MHSKIKRGVEKELKNIYVTRVFSFLSPICPCMISLIVLKQKNKKNKTKTKKQKNKKTKSKKQKETNAFTWLQACFLGNVRVIRCNTLGNSHFQTNVIDDVQKFVWSLSTYHILCTLYTY